jgi:hypothetical protein
MGKDVFTRSLYSDYVKTSRGIDLEKGLNLKGVTREAEQQAMHTGKLQTLVDPSSFNVVRLSLVRVEKREDGKFEMLVGCSMPIETRVDTTGSMGGNVDVALKVLPDVYECCTEVLPGYDIHICTGIFGDVRDKFPLCRPQFEMQAQKIADQLTMMVPERNGGDAPEDPDLGIFGGAYLCRHYINRIGLKGYDFTITDAPGRGLISSKELKRVYSDEVFDKCVLNGHGDKVYSDVEKKTLKNNGVFELSDVWEDLLKRAHGFVLLLGSNSDTRSWWVEQVGKKHVVSLPSMEYSPQVQAVIIGLTEGTLTLDGVADFLQKYNLKKDMIDNIVSSVSNIPMKAQAKLKGFKKRPVKGDLFDGKPDVWADTNLFPTGHNEEVAVGTEEANDWV